MEMDPVTTAAYGAAANPVARAQAVRDSLGSGELRAEIWESSTMRFQGIFNGPMVVGGDGSMSINVTLAGTPTATAVPDPATWKVLLTNGTRFVGGSLGVGGRFTLKNGVLEAGESMRLNILIQPAWVDALSEVLKTLPVDTWSGNIATNKYFNIVERNKNDPDFTTYYCAPGQASANVSSTNPWSYCSGVYVPGKRQYWFTGGGHDDWIGSEIAKFDCATLTWTRTDESGKVKNGEGDPTVPFQSSDMNGWRVWRNPSGRFAPISCHMYGGMTYVPSLNKILVQGSATFNSGQGSPGGSHMIDLETGHWYDAGAFAGGGIGNDIMSLLVPEVTVVDNVTLTPTGEILTDCVFRTNSSTMRLLDPVNKTVATNVYYWSASYNRFSHGCLAPDPIYPGWKAYVADSSALQFGFAPRVNMRKQDGTSHNQIQAFNYGNTKPAEIGAIGSTTRWINMGDFIPGCTKIAVFKGGVGVYALDFTTWTWSGPHAPMVAHNYADGGIMKRVEYFSDYDCFGAWDPKGETLQVMRRPSIFS